MNNEFISFCSFEDHSLGEGRIFLCSDTTYNYDGTTQAATSTPVGEGII